MRTRTHPCADVAPEPAHRLRRAFTASAVALAVSTSTVAVAGHAGAAPPKPDNPQSTTAGSPASVTLISSNVAAGGSISASGASFGANAKVLVTLDQTTALGTTTTDKDGAFSSTSLTIAAETKAGAHTLQFVTPAASVKIAITVAPATRAKDSRVAPVAKYEVADTLDGPGGSYEVAVDQGLGRAFVASPKDGASGSIAVIDLASGKVADTWTLKAAPYGIAVNSTTHLIYTADTRTNQVSVIDAKTGTVRAVIEDVASPHGLEVDSRHNLVYVTKPGAGQIDVIDGAKNAIVTSVGTGKTPVQVAVDGPHDSYWVASTGDNTVREYDRVTNALQATVNTADGPQNLVVNEATGDLVVDNFGAASVQVIDTATATVSATIPVAESPIGVSVDPSTDAYFITHLAADPDTKTSTVSVIDGASKTVSQTLTVPGTALGVGTDRVHHNTYVTNRDDKQISVIAPVGDNEGPGSGDGPHQGSVVISTTIPETGGLAMSVANKSVVLSDAEPNSALTALVSTGTLPTVTVADLRATNPGWTATGTLTQFSSGDASFSGARMGWTPEVLTSGDDQTVVAGPTVRSAESGGLEAGSVLASAAAGAGVGTATLNAALTLNVPTDTTPGTYAATLTMTVI